MVSIMLCFLTSMRWMSERNALNKMCQCPYNASSVRGALLNSISSCVLYIAAGREVGGIIIIFSCF